MIDITQWMEQFLRAVEERFGDRLWFVGLQGSYGRGEATETSDIDPVVILDALTPAAVAAYTRIV
jgi:predicted nucleotidyltransferase